jgi:Cu/Zn superoxide dismutase
MENELERLAALTMACALVTGCAPAGTMPPPLEGGGGAARPGPPPAQVAVLKGLGSAVLGKVIVVDRGDGVSLMFSAQNMPVGQYRIALHENGNCSSPNGFSAGPPWAPAGRDPAALIPVLYAGNDGANSAEVGIGGVRLTGENGVAGRSVMIYTGTTIGGVRPGVPNNALACGVFEPGRPVF